MDILKCMNKFTQKEANKICDWILSLIKEMFGEPATPKECIEYYKSGKYIAGCAFRNTKYCRGGKENLSQFNKSIEEIYQTKKAKEAEDDLHKRSIKSN